MVSPGKRPARNESDDEEENSQDSGVNRAVSFRTPVPSQADHAKAGQASEAGERSS